MTLPQPNGQKIDGWIRTALTVGTVVVGLAYGWGVIETRLNGLERHLSALEAKLDKMIERELARSRDRSADR